MEKHASYVSCILTSLKDKGVSAKKLSVFLLYLPAFNPLAEKKHPLLFDVRDELKKAATIEEIFITLSDVCSFFDCKTFELMVKEYNLDQNQEQLKYPEHLKTYMESHKISEFIQVNPLLKKLNDESVPLVFKFDLDATCTLADHDGLKLAVAKLLDLEAAALRLLDINEGCITSTYLISPSIADVIFTSDKKFTPKEIEHFQVLSVRWLKYGERTFSFEGRASHTAVKRKELVCWVLVL